MNRTVQHGGEEAYVDEIMRSMQITYGKAPIA
jgi:hypothetical protein